jgi:hypothetical protein
MAGDAVLKRLVLAGVIALSGSGLYYHIHSHTTDCGQIMSAGIRAGYALDRWIDGAPDDSVLPTIDAAYARLLRTHMKPPLGMDALRLGARLASVASDIRSGDRTQLSYDTRSTLEVVRTLVRDCRRTPDASSG